MKTTKLLMICGIAAGLAAGAIGAFAQTNTINTPNGPINIVDTARQRYMQHVRDGLGLTNEADWNAIEPLVEQVFEAQRELSLGGGLGSGPIIHRGGNGTNNVAMAPNGRRMRFGLADPTADALQNALDNGESADQIKADLEAYRASQKAKRTKLAAAQENLRQALNIQQEAQAVLLKVLD
jgi:hypothetical protein